MEIKKTYCTVEKMFSKIYERLATNEWKVDVWHGNTTLILQSFEQPAAEFEKYNFDDDELLIEQKVSGIDDLDWTPIVVGCFKREPEIDYGNIPVDTPIDQRKDFSQRMLQKPGKMNLSKSEAAIYALTDKWFMDRLQIHTYRKNGVDVPRGYHVSYSDFKTLTGKEAQARMWLSIRHYSVLTLIKAQETLGIKAGDNARMFIFEDYMFEKKKMKSAIALFDISIKLDNENFIAWWWKGFVLYKMKNYEEAEQCFKTSRIMNPQWTHSLFYEAKMLILRGYPNSGLEKINDAIEIDPENMFWRTFRARVFDAMGRYGDAIVEFDEAIILFHKQKYSVKHLQFLLYSKFIALEKSGYRDESTKVLNTLLELNPNQKLKEKFAESIKTKKISAEQISELEKEVEIIQDFVLTKDAEENIKKLVDILKKLTDFIYWSDQYFSKNGFEWIREACLENNSLNEVKILSGIERKEELLNRPFKRKMDQLKKFLNEKNIKFQVKVVSDDKLRERFHGRFLISKDVILTLPSVNNFNSGSMDVVSKVDITIKDTEFLEWWEKSMDYVKFRDENRKN